MITAETLRTLEFDRILATLAGFAHSDATRAEITALRPLAEREAILARFGQVEEIRRLASLNIGLPLAPFRDIGPSLELVRPAGAILNPDELLVFLPVLRILAAVARQFGYRQDIPRLQELAGFVTGYPDILESLAASLADDGEILDTASKLLFELRTRKRALTARIRKRLEEIVRERQTAIFLQDDFITQRNGRWVIPVRMDSKGMVPGVVHDVSNSGETAFMEPLEIIGLANELENLAADEKAEMIRIIRVLSAWIREESDGIEREFRALVQLDLLNSIATLADLLEAQVPELSEVPVLRLVGARHPQLVLLQKEKGGGAVVPLDLRLGGDDRVMVITGPNTGGKTIAIKTVGLIVLMALSGMPVPAGATSVVPRATRLLADIGDEQSIEASLSTFSAHIGKISRILGQADERTVVLLDELGTGTDPVQGGAIGCGVLHELLAAGALTLATTHLVDIVGFVHRTPGMVNAAMEFDQATLSPRYRLSMGEPGQSHALEIARRHGLPERVIAFAEGRVGRHEQEFHDLLAELRQRRDHLREREAAAQRRERELADREEGLAEREREQERQARERAAAAFQQAKELVQATKREMAGILEELRREKRKEAAARKLAAAEASVEARLAELSPEAPLDPDALREGDTVFVRSIGYDARVLKIDRRAGRLRVRAGNRELEVAVADVARPRGKSAASSPTRGATVSAAPARAELKLIGQRVDDALAELESFLNRAALEGYGEVRVVHGAGTGALRRAVREHLTGHPLVEEYRPGAPYEGGDGATVVRLR